MELKEELRVEREGYEAGYKKAEEETQINNEHDDHSEVRVVGSHEWIHTKDGSRRKAPRPSFLFILRGKQTNGDKDG